MPGRAGTPHGLGPHHPQFRSHSRGFGWEQARTRQWRLQQERLFWVGKEHMGGSWGQELPFPRESGNNGVSSERGQKGLGLAADLRAAPAGSVTPRCPMGQGSCREHAGPEVLFLKRNCPGSSSRDPVNGESGTAAAAGVGDPAFATHALPTTRV